MVGCILVVSTVFTAAFALQAQANPARLRDRVFTQDSRTFTPIDIESMDVHYRFDPKKKSTTGQAKIRFTAVASGTPYLLMEPAITGAVLTGGSRVNVSSIQDPDGLTQFRALDVRLRKSQTQEVTLDFSLPNSLVTNFNQTGVGFLAAMSDVGGWRFFNRYGPANYETDTYAMNVTLELVGSARDHQVYANGNVTKESANAWKVSFPAHYTASSFFLHFTCDPAIVEEKLVYEGLEKAIPITIYSKQASLARDAAARIQGLFRELEATFGPYAHDQFIALINPGTGGMEYVGSTITSLSALGHELTHSWFARGVMPADGRSGWMDEAIASWRDYEYFRTTPSLFLSPTNLSDYSIFQFNTAPNSYKDGRLLLSQIDVLLRDEGGLKPALAEFFRLKKLQTVTTEEFLAFLKIRSPRTDLTPYFNRYVYGRGSRAFSIDTPMSMEMEWGEDRNLHPTELTPEEESALR